ncbi:hypothetical protein [Gilliamella apicola]|uniref:hypothetical protein n=1 Tax=Gilliamella apicola TaxID=1196095 RepID=UPI002FEDED4B
MRKTKIPYDLINQLEADFGSLSNVPEDNPTLINIRKILEFEGYKLVRCDSRVLWGELKKGQKYYQNGQLLVKK